MKKLFLLFLVVLCSASSFQNGSFQNGQMGVITAAGGGGPTYVNSGADYTSGATSFTTGWSPANGNTLIVFIQNANAADVTAVSDGEGTGNSYVKDANIASGSSIHGTVFRCSNISGSGTYTISVTGSTTPAIVVMEISGNRTLAAVSSGSNPATTTASGASPTTPASFTTTDANCILVDFFADDTGSAMTIGQVNGSYTTVLSHSDGSTGFVGAIGYQIVSVAGAYTDGWTSSAPHVNLAINAAYK